MKADQDSSRYALIMEQIFLSRYMPGSREIAFEREDITRTAAELGVVLPKNLGDVLYSFRSRRQLPAAVRATEPTGEEWIIVSVGRSKYRFELTRQATVRPNPLIAEIKAPDATPGLIALYTHGDEQALLARLRYNRLIDIFTGVTCYSLQSHLRTTVRAMGQVETDELYVGVDRKGAHYVFPVQAKGGSDALGTVQIRQDFALCAEKFPTLTCRPIGAQFMTGGVIALFEFTQVGHDVSLSPENPEKHYRLVPMNEMTAADLEQYRHQGAH